jgi:hypothetical protein
VTKPIPPTVFPTKCRTQEGRDKLLDFMTKRVKAAAEVAARSQQYAVFSALGPHTFTIQRQLRLVLVEVGAESVGARGFVIKIWVNGRESSLERLPNAIIAAWESDGEDGDEDA